MLLSSLSGIGGATSKRVGPELLPELPQAVLPNTPKESPDLDFGRSGRNGREHSTDELVAEEGAGLIRS